VKLRKLTALLLSIITAASMFSIPAYADDNNAQQTSNDTSTGSNELSNSELEMTDNKFDFQLSSDDVENDIADNKSSKDLESSGATADVPSRAADTYSNTAADYTYTVTPLLEPFNRYFFVKTDNLDPTSFRFADKSSAYNENSTLSAVNTLFADIVYDDNETMRVDGGYIFYSGNTDGGEIVLQSKDMSGNDWKDTDITLELPVLKDNVDYLIDTYADKSSFFENMDAVQKGFSSICLYSDSYIQGKLKRNRTYWYSYTSIYKDQGFYIKSPFSRTDSRSLFASYVYPYTFDSIGFPSMMRAVAYRLDDSCSCVWSNNYHYLIEVTYNGETHKYGGQGSGKGQYISEDNIEKYFSFDTDTSDITLENMYNLLKKYSQMKIEDDIPRDGAFTWEDIYNTIGTGAWVRLDKNTSLKNSDLDDDYTYFYPNNYGSKHFLTSEFGAGDSVYFSGSLSFLSDTWVDGHYISEYHNLIMGEKFEDHQTSNIMLMQVTLPQINYSPIYTYDSTNHQYEITNYKIYSITEKTQDVLFNYNDGVWQADEYSFDSGFANYDTIVSMVELGMIDEKYLDMVTLTPEEVGELNVDGKTNLLPETGYIYDGTTEPGTPFINHNPESELKNTSEFSTYEINVGDTVDINCSAEGGSGDYNYAIYYRRSNQNTWKTKSEMSKTSSVKFSPQYEDTYFVKIDVKDSIGNFKTKIIKARVVKEFKNVSTISATSVCVGDTVKINFKTEGTRDSLDNYEIMYKHSYDYSWTTLYDSKINKTVNLIPDRVGTYYVTVYIKGTIKIPYGNNYSMNSQETKYKQFKITVFEELENKSTISASTVKAGKTVEITGDAEGGNGPYEYAFYYKRGNASSWTTKAEMGKATSVKISPYYADTYTIKVDVKDSNGSIRSKTFTVQSTKALENKSTVSTSTVSIGKTVKITGNAEGGSGPYQYAFYYKRGNASSWTTKSEMGKADYVYLSPQYADTYTIKVDVKDSSGTTKSKTFTVQSTKALQNKSTVSTSTVKAGKAVKITGDAEGGSGPYQYAFYYKRGNASSWTTKAEMGKAASIELSPYYADTYTVKVDVKDSSGTTKSKTFTIKSVK